MGVVQARSGHRLVRAESDFLRGADRHEIEAVIQPLVRSSKSEIVRKCAPLPCYRRRTSASPDTPAAAVA